MCSQKFCKFHRKAPVIKFFLIDFKSRHRNCSIQRAVLNNSAIFTGNTRVGVTFSKVPDLQDCSIIKKRP